MTIINKKQLYGKQVDDIYVLQGSEFVLYDLKVEVIYNQQSKGGDSLQQEYFRKKEGHFFELIGENLYLPEGQPFSIYDLSAILPLLGAKQRETSRNDRMTSDAEISTPDPYCPYRIKITRTGRRVFSHEETSDVILDS